MNNPLINITANRINAAYATITNLSIGTIGISDFACSTLNVTGNSLLNNVTANSVNVLNTGTIFNYFDNFAFKHKDYPSGYQIHLSPTATTLSNATRVNIFQNDGVDASITLVDGEIVNKVSSTFSIADSNNDTILSIGQNGILNVLNITCGILNVSGNTNLSNVTANAIVCSSLTVTGSSTFGESGLIPSMRSGSWNSTTLSRFQTYLSGIQAPSPKYFSVLQLENQDFANMTSYSYSGAIYSPTQDIVYFVPYNQATIRTWHHMDCKTNQIISYNPNVTINTAQAYSGACYAPTLNRIYFIPFKIGNVSLSSSWHYIDCNNGAIVPYAHGLSNFTASLYDGGVYSPVNDRIYFSPNGMEASATWHYIDCSTGTVVAYNPGANVDGYHHGCYVPTLDKIYFTGRNTFSTTWHYLNCQTSTAVAYSAPTTNSNVPYFGAVYSPIQNRVYFVPWSQSFSATWHYLDCATETFVSYVHGASNLTFQAYQGGVYSPTHNRIYFVPDRQSSNATWHYIDCSTGNIIGYSHGASNVTLNAFRGGVYTPQNKIIFSPYSQGPNATWHYIDEMDNLPISKHVVANGIFNKF